MEHHLLLIRVFHHFIIDYPATNNSIASSKDCPAFFVINKAVSCK